ncbi:MAG: glycine--tRNA ligase subunit beta, partial [Lysobacterales bacterium]
MHENPTPADQQAEADLLIEIGCEELPPKALDGLREALFTAVCAGLEREQVVFDGGSSCAYSSPRRLALLLKAVPSRQADQVQERRGPALTSAFDANGKLTGAALGFARSLGVAADQLQTIETVKGKWLAALVHVQGRALGDIIFPVLEQAIRELPLPRPMRWAGHDFSFVRPVHWLVVLHGSHVLHGELLGRKAGNTTLGHRTHSPGPHVISRAAAYLEVLRKAYVLADQEVRRAKLRDALLARNPATRLENSLLAEVSNLVEWPVVIECTFDAAFLELPHQVLVASMQDHQKLFPVCAAPGKTEVSNHFMAVANLESANESLVREGFE